MNKPETSAITLKIPGDKSISHRALLFNSLSNGAARIKNLLMGEDVWSTIDCLRKLGVDIRVEEDVCINRLWRGLLSTFDSLNCGNSGTTMRLLLGLLAPHPIQVVLTGDESLSRRPMGRITNYLSPMGVSYEGSRDLTPIKQTGCASIDYFEAELHIASAQMKSALLVTGVQSKGCTVRGGKNSRDHTERMLRGMGATVLQLDNGDVSIQPTTLSATDITVPNDISSAAFFIVAGLFAAAQLSKCPTSVSIQRGMEFSALYIKWVPLFRCLIVERSGENLSQI